MRREDEVRMMKREVEVMREDAEDIITDWLA